MIFDFIISCYFDLLLHIFSMRFFIDFLLYDFLSGLIMISCYAFHTVLLSFLVLYLVMISWFQNIFPLANSFAKWKMLDVGRHPTEPSGENNCIFLVVLDSVIEYPQLEYMWNLMIFRVYCNKPHVWEKSMGRDIWAQSWQSRLFLAFFSVFRI